MLMNSLFQNAAWLLLEKLTKLGVAFVLMGLIARKLGPEDFGVLSLGLALVTIIWAAASLGLDQVLLKEFFNDGYSDEALFSTAFVLRLGAALLLAVPGLALVWLYAGLSVEHRLAYSIMLGSLLFYNFTTYQTYFQAKGRSSNIAKVGLLSLLFTSLVKVWLLLNDYGLLAFAWSMVLDVAVNLALFYLLRGVQPIVIRLASVDWRIFQSLWRAALPMLVSSLVIVVYTRVDQLMIASMMGVAQAGVFSVAVRIVESFAVVPMLVATAFFPLLCANPSAQTTRGYFDVVFFTAWTGAAAVWLVSQWLVPWLFGAEYLPALGILHLSLIAAVFSVVGVACTHYLVVMNLGYLRPVRLLGGLLLNVMLNYLLIPLYGLAGAAWATLASQLFASWLGNLLNRKTHECLRLQCMTLLTLGVPGVRAAMLGAARGALQPETNRPQPQQDKP